MRTLLLATLLLLGCGDTDPTYDFHTDPTRYIVGRMQACLISTEDIVHWRSQVPEEALKVCMPTWGQCVNTAAASLEDCPILRIYIGSEPPRTPGDATRVAALYNCSKQCGYSM